MATAIEYGLIAGLVGVAAISIGQYMQDEYASFESTSVTVVSKVDAREHIVTTQQGAVVHILCSLPRKPGDTIVAERIVKISKTTGKSTDVYHPHIWKYNC